MPEISAPEQTDELRHSERVSLTIADLDRGFRLKSRTATALTFPLLYGQFGANVDVTALRAAGNGSVLTYAEHERTGGPLAVGAPMDVDLAIRHSELSGAGLGDPAARLGFECRYDLRSPIGTGDPKRYRDIADPTPSPCGHGRLVLTLIRPFGPITRRLVREPLPETAHLRVHPLDPPHPTVEELSTVPGALTDATPANVESAGWFGLQHTDTNQYVFSAELLRLLEDHATLLVGDAGLAVAGHTFEKVAALFKKPFEAGSRYVVRGRLWTDEQISLAIVGIHQVSEDGVAPQPAVYGRLQGRLDS